MVIKVPISMDQTSEDPEIKLSKDRLVIVYDSVDDDSQSREGRLIFEEVLAFEYRDEACCPAENVLPSCEIKVLDSSGYLDSVRVLWSERVGWQDWERKKGGAGRFRHFICFFDDFGCLDVIASSCQAEG